MNCLSFIFSIIYLLLPASCYATLPSIKPSIMSARVCVLQRAVPCILVKVGTDRFCRMDIAFCPMLRTFLYFHYTLLSEHGIYFSLRYKGTLQIQRGNAAFLLYPAAYLYRVFLSCCFRFRTGHRHRCRFRLPAAGLSGRSYNVNSPFSNFSRIF